jgi:hypothetical protein
MFGSEYPTSKEDMEELEAEQIKFSRALVGATG